MYSVAGKPVFIREDDKCGYHFEWATSLACPVVTNEMNCELYNANSHYDLRALTLDNSNYEVRSGTDIYVFNVCGPVVRRAGYECPTGAAACRLTQGNLPPISNI